jgi:hypothetical protein
MNLESNFGFQQLGRGFSARSMDQCLKFYMTQKRIPQTLSAISRGEVLKTEEALSAVQGGVESAIGKNRGGIRGRHA